MTHRKQEVDRLARATRQNDPFHDGLYAPSGIDVLNILLQIRCRPNPQVELGNVDSGVALVLCDAGIEDLPIVYCSEPFTNLTGYSHAEIIGTNCRFLQHPPGRHGADHNANQNNTKARDEVKQSLALGHEARVKLVNFRKDGSEFINILTLIPIDWQGKSYVVGFQADEASFYR
ncbi:vivid PAS protein VVD [Diplocarpon rosae]|nr:vivid PAS protein VVD [Diplocarpon rosae]